MRKILARIFFVVAGSSLLTGVINAQSGIGYYVDVKIRVHTFRQLRPSVDLRWHHQ